VAGRILQHPAEPLNKGHPIKNLNANKKKAACETIRQKLVAFNL